MKKHNLTIQGLRGLLALLVVIRHVYSGLVSEELLNPLEGAWVDSLAKVSVNLFFVISGYLIIQSLVKHQDLSKFFINRALRIYPVFLVIHLLVFTAGPMINYKWMSGLSLNEYVFHFTANLLLLPGIFSNLPIAQLVSWSVSYEFLFYILMGLLFVAKSNADSKRNKFILTATLLVSALFVFFHPRALFFIVGILIYKTIDSINKKRRYRPVFYFNGLILFSLLVLLYDMVPLFVSLLLSFFLFISFVNEEGLLSGILQTKVFHYLGNISYSLYLWHTFVMFPIKIVLLPKIAAYTDSPVLLFAFFFLTSLSLSILVSHFSYKFIEQRFTEYLKGKIHNEKNVQDTKVKTV